MTDKNDWLVFHRVRFTSPLDGLGKPLPGPKGADAWVFNPASPIGPNGMRTGVADQWGGFGIYASRAAAQEVYDNPADHLPFLGDTTEVFHALVVPITHRGKVNWRGKLMEDSTFTPLTPDPGGPLIVFTSAGYDEGSNPDPERVKNFIRGVDEVVEFYGTLPDNIRRAVFSGSATDADGMTASIWRNDAAMLQAAYKPGYHREQIDYQRDHSHFDYSSFTRGRILAHKGTWDGSDPVLEVDQ